MSLSILIPAHDEAQYIGACLDAVLASRDVACPVQVLVIANGCSDATAEIARRRAEPFAAKGWTLDVIELAEGGKLGALNAGENVASGDMRAYLDADVIVSPPLMAQLVVALDGDQPRYATGTPRISPAASYVTAAYARFWQRLPFVTDGAPGFGVFAVNSAGRRLWNDFPSIISDDTFVRLQFAPEARIKVDATYQWPMVEGFGALVRVRRRQDAGVAEIRQRFPALMANDDPKRSDTPVWQRFLRDPAGFAIYGSVALATRLRGNRDPWARGR